MIVKRKLYSVMDEEGNLGYYLYNESTGEEKLFSAVRKEALFPKGTYRNLPLEYVDSNRGINNLINKINNHGNVGGKYERLVLTGKTNKPLINEIKANLSAAKVGRLLKKVK